MVVVFKTFVDVLYYHLNSELTGLFVAADVVVRRHRIRHHLILLQLLDGS